MTTSEPSVGIRAIEKGIRDAFLMLCSGSIMSTLGEPAPFSWKARRVRMLGSSSPIAGPALRALGRYEGSAQRNMCLQCTAALSAPSAITYLNPAATRFLVISCARTNEQY
eukprot:1820631-Prymnesium_polylepis.2